MHEIIRKLTSRKLWVALAGLVTGIALILGGDAGEISSISGAVLSGASIISYIFAEASIDKAAAKSDAILVDGIEIACEAEEK